MLVLLRLTAAAGSGDFWFTVALWAGGGLVIGLLMLIDSTLRLPPRSPRAVVRCPACGQECRVPRAWRDSIFEFRPHFCRRCTALRGPGIWRDAPDPKGLHDSGEGPYGRLLVARDRVRASFGAPIEPQPDLIAAPELPPARRPSRPEPERPPLWDRRLDG